MVHIVGVDAHKRTHTMVVVNEVGRKLGEKTIPTATLGHTAVLKWVHSRGRQG
jgi:transposase